MRTHGAWCTALLTLAMLMPQTAVSQAQPAETVVFVHGATGGGWSWKDVDHRLRARGIIAYRPTLTGLGQDTHNASPDIGLETHIEDIINVFLFEELTDVTLVAHSYGGMVATAVADRIPDRIRRLVYVDAFVPFDGDSVEDFFPGMLAAMSTGAGDRAIEGYVVPVWSPVDAPLPRDVPQSLKTFTDRISLQNAPGHGISVTYLLTRDAPDQADDFDPWADRARELGWEVVEMTADHTPYNSRPDEFFEILLRIIRKGGTDGS